jgi:NAD-dependent deacetylase
MKKIVILTGAGISAESGLKTFRDSGGLWEEHRIEDVATFDGWQRNPQLVLNFYNERRKQLILAEPNAAHKALVRLEEQYDVQIITQNVDDLHERAGSSKVIHLHGELKKVRSTLEDELIYELDGWELNMGDKCEKGSQLRPHIVWFGEAVPMIEIATQLTAQADIFIVIGTSLNVYPAASLIGFVPENAPMFLIDPNSSQLPYVKRLEIIDEKAGIGTPSLVTRLLNKAYFL